MTEISTLENVRLSYQPKLPKVFTENGTEVSVTEGNATTSVADNEAMQKRFPNTYGLPLVEFQSGEQSDNLELNLGVVLSGGQAPGGHNVIAGLFDALKSMNRDNKLFGFKKGPDGLIKKDYIILDDDTIDAYRNTGGFDMIASGRTKLETEDQFATVTQNCRDLGVNALVIIGGDDSNTNACLLAEYFEQNDIEIKVIGCPKTIDGDLKSAQIETSFGFDTATKVYSELIGNLQRDTNSAQKYWHFIRLMGRSASHITLECALQTQPNVTIISEEVAEREKTLNQVVEDIASAVAKRAEKGLDFGVVLLPEGLIEFFPEINALIGELNDIMADNEQELKTIEEHSEKVKFVESRLSTETSTAFTSLPAEIQQQLLEDRDPHGNVQVSRIETEKMLIEMVDELLTKWQTEGKYNGKFKTHAHFFGYEGRCSFPSNFDADYCYSIGYTAACLAASGRTGYMAAVNNLHLPAEQWQAGGIPLTMMMNMERRKGGDHPVIKKALVELNQAPFKEFAAKREEWAENTCYKYPGPIQYYGPAELSDCTTKTLQLEHANTNN